MQYRCCFPTNNSILYSRFLSPPIHEAENPLTLTPAMLYCVVELFALESPNEVESRVAISICRGSDETDRKTGSSLLFTSAELLPFLATRVLHWSGESRLMVATRVPPTAAGSAKISRDYRENRARACTSNSGNFADGSLALRPSSAVF